MVKPRVGKKTLLQNLRAVVSANFWVSGNFRNVGTSVEITE
jgi:hypothetical protein